MVQVKTAMLHLKHKKIEAVMPQITHIPVKHENMLHDPLSFALKTTFLRTLSILQYPLQNLASFTCILYGFD